eukprot:1504996-Alexandrium_andersonii.AAC.1
MQFKLRTPETMLHLPQGMSAKSQQILFCTLPSAESAIRKLLKVHQCSNPPSPAIRHVDTASMLQALGACT